MEWNHSRTRCQYNISVLTYYGGFENFLETLGQGIQSSGFKDLQEKKKKILIFMKKNKYDLNIILNVWKEKRIWLNKEKA